MDNLLITHIHLYSGTVTAGMDDGTCISEGDFTRPLTIGVLNINNQEVSKPAKCALRCDPGIYTIGRTIVSLVGEGALNWQFALNNASSDPDDINEPLSWFPWGSPLLIDSSVGDTNYVIWIRARAVNTDKPGKDTSVTIQIDTNLFGS